MMPENLSHFLSPTWKLNNPYYQTLEKNHEMKEEIQEFIEEEPLEAWQEQFFQDTLNSRLNSQTISTENNTNNRVDVNDQEVLEISGIDNQLKIIPRNSLVYKPERNHSKARVRQTTTFRY